MINLNCIESIKTSKQGTATVSEAIKGLIDFQHEQHLESLTTARKMRAKAKEDGYILKFDGHFSGVCVCVCVCVCVLCVCT